MMKNTYKETQITGLFLYKVKNQVVYHDFFSKNGFVITSDTFKKFSFYQMRIPFGIMIGSVFYLFKNDAILSVVLGFCFFVVLEIAFRFLFLRKCPIIKDFKKPPRESLLVCYAKQFSYPRLVIIIILSLAMDFFLIINLKYLEQTRLSYIMNSILIVVASILYLLSCYVTIIKKKNNY